MKPGDLAVTCFTSATVWSHPYFPTRVRRTVVGHLPEETIVIIVSTGDDDKTGSPVDVLVLSPENVLGWVSLSNLEDVT